MHLPSRRALAASLRRRQRLYPLVLSLEVSHRRPQPGRVRADTRRRRRRARDQRQRHRLRRRRHQDKHRRRVMEGRSNARPRWLPVRSRCALRLQPRLKVRQPRELLLESCPRPYPSPLAGLSPREARRRELVTRMNPTRIPSQGTLGLVTTQGQLVTSRSSSLKIDLQRSWVLDKTVFRGKAVQRWGLRPRVTTRCKGNCKRMRTLSLPADCSLRNRRLMRTTLRWPECCKQRRRQPSVIHGRPTLLQPARRCQLGRSRSTHRSPKWMRMVSCTMQTEPCNCIWTQTSKRAHHDLASPGRRCLASCSLATRIISRPRLTGLHFKTGGYWTRSQE
mmetsp:Transcript_15332/g.33243  ORF Transcript_15332/g.33243 Transcript_15332/m.33243 type:complete len:335 (+) Transcript_15332:249-1253(+)